MSLRKFVTAAAATAALALPMAVGTAGVADAAPAIDATTITYNVSAAPDYASVIREGISHWNGKLSNVQFQETSGNANLTYHEGDYSQGSYYQGNGAGDGDIYIDNTQAGQYDQTRIAAHETGHDLGLPDHYSGPCSELMSGGGPGTSCTNSYPNATEVSQADGNFSVKARQANAGDKTQVIYGF
jgi:snapalysin